jgi:hypothetical protein
VIDAFTFTACTGRAVAETMLPSRQALRKMEDLLQIVGMMVQAEVVEWAGIQANTESIQAIPF